jgi:DNA-binding NarL/FixJ family response regulator
MTGSKQSNGKSVMVIAVEPAAHSLLHAMHAAAFEVEWLRSIAELRARVARDDLPAPQVVFLDLDLPEAGADELVPLAREHCPLATIIALAAELTGERAAWLLIQGVPSLAKPVSPLVLAGLALRISLGGPPAALAAPSLRLSTASPAAAVRTDSATHLESMFRSYSVDRELSKQQRMILRLYLDGMNDKEIAQVCRCAEATVYEHWRRMARKAGGSHKGDVISDFHRFLATG